MTPEQTLDWLAEQHKSQCNEDRPVQEWIRSMKSMLPAPVQEPVAYLHDDGFWTAAKTYAGRQLNDRLLFAGSAKIGVYTTPPAAQPAPVQEPVTYCEIHHLPEPCVQCAKEHEGYNTTPPAAQRQWVGLTNDEREEVMRVSGKVMGKPLARAIEAKLKEKNT
jgi:hypothetical protein